MVCEFPSSPVEAMEKTNSKYTRKWLGIHPTTTDVALYSKGVKLAVPLKSILEEYKGGKARLALMLQNSTDAAVRDVAPTIRTGSKWQANRVIEETISVLQHKEVTSYTQASRRGFNHTSNQW
jgi:hypothetical protein